MTALPKLSRGQQFILDEKIELQILECIYQESLTGRALYKVLNKIDGLYYALKLFDLSLNEGQTIKAEMLALNRQLQRPEMFPRFRSYFEKDGWGFLRMDWMEGQSLRQVYKSVPSSKLDVIPRLAALLSLCRAVEDVHKVGMLHRDLKPENVLMRSSKEPYRDVILIDFGLSVTRRRSGEGSPNYQAPEQEFKRDFNLNEATDIYAIGQIGWWLITGQPFIAYPNDDYTNWSDIEDGILCKIIPHAPEKLEKILFRALAFNPNQRYKHVRQFSNDLNFLLKTV